MSLDEWFYCFSSVKLTFGLSYLVFQKFGANLFLLIEIDNPLSTCLIEMPSDFNNLIVLKMFRPISISWGNISAVVLDNGYPITKLLF